MTRIPDPLHAAYDAMTEAEKKNHIEQHTGVAESYVEIFEMCSGYRVQLIPEGAWGTSLRYTARIHCIKSGFAVDRAYSVENQMKLMELGLDALQKAYEHWQLTDEVRKIIDLHGVTDAEKV